MNISQGTETAGQGAEMGVDDSADGALAHKASIAAAGSVDLCPSCGDSAFVRIEGCQTCYACGYSEC